MADGAITFDKVEVKFNLDEAGEPQGVYFKVQRCQPSD
jgi:ribonuclease R